MDPDLQITHQKLRSLRERKDLALKPTALLRPTYEALDGEEKPFRLRYYQVQMVFHLLAMRNFVVGDDTGVGKTVEVIAALAYLWGMYPDKKAVVLAKKAAVLQWAGEFERFTDGVQVIVATGTAAERKHAYRKFQAAKGRTVLITGYRSMVRDIKEVQDWSGHVLVLDEITVAKNPGTQVHQLCRHLGAKADRTWALTATLIKNNLLEGFGIYQVVVPGLFQHTKNAFMNDYCIIRMQRVANGRQIPVVVGYKAADIERFKDKIDPFYLGRPKHEIADELPILTSRIIEVGMTDLQQKLYKDAIEGLIEKGTGEEKETDKLTSLIYCQEIVNHPCLLDYKEDTVGSEKMDALLDLITDGGEFEGEKVIIYTRFRRLVDFAVPFMEKQGIRCVRVTGAEVKETQRQAAMNTFQDPKSGVDVIWITDAGGDSVNLQAAKALIYYDTPWSGGDYIQILGRMIRIGSLHDRVYALHLVVKGTIDSRVQQVKNKKMKLIEAVLGARIKGEKEPDVVLDAGSGAGDLYDFLVEDAKRGKVK
jgi:SNF2 family DNA or RNA helicase